VLSSILKSIDLYYVRYCLHGPGQSTKLQLVLFRYAAVKLYETGPSIAVKLGRTCVAILRRSFTEPIFPCKLDRLTIFGTRPLSLRIGI
jgi:hypothetical protein